MLARCQTLLLIDAWDQRATNLVSCVGLGRVFEIRVRSSRAVSAGQRRAREEYSCRSAAPPHPGPRPLPLGPHSLLAPSLRVAPRIAHSPRMLTHTQIFPVIATCGHRCGLHMTATTATPLAVLTGLAFK